MAVDKKQLNSQGFSLRNSWLLTQTKTAVTILPTQTSCTIFWGNSRISHTFATCLIPPEMAGISSPWVKFVKPPSTNTLPVSCSASICHYDPSLAKSHWTVILASKHGEAGKHRMGENTPWTQILNVPFTPKLPLNTSYIEYLGEGVLFLWVFVCVCACVRVNVINQISRWWAGILNFQSELANSKNHDADS